MTIRKEKLDINILHPDNLTLSASSLCHYPQRHLIKTAVVWCRLQQSLTTLTLAPAVKASANILQATGDMRRAEGGKRTGGKADSRQAWSAL